MSHKLLKIAILSLFVSLVACGGGGGGGGGVPVSKGIYLLTVNKSADATPITDARVSIFDQENIFVTTSTTDALGQVSIKLKNGIYTARIQAQGFQMSPPRGIGAIPFTIEANKTLEANIALDSMASPENLAILQGNAAATGDRIPVVAGALVVAEDSVQNIAFSGLTDKDGNYVLFNVLPGSYHLTAFKAGYTSTAFPPQSVSALDELTVDIDVDADSSLADLTGQITFLAAANGIVDISLIHPLTLDTIPGLSTKNGTSNTYTLANVPVGHYLAWASFDNDGYVMDPDWINKNDGYPVALEVTMATSEQTKDFSITDSVELVSPTNADDDMTPAIVDNLTPTFSWLAYPSTKHYVIEVFDLKGNSIWGGYTFDNGTQDSTFKHTDIGEDLSVVYNFDATASEALQDGQVYLWRVYAFDGATPPPKVAISSSEQQMGLFKVVLPAP